MTDLESAVVEMVFALAPMFTAFHDPTWCERWEAAGAHPDADKLAATIREAQEQMAKKDA